MEFTPILVQVSEDIFSHMADDLKYIGETTFRCWSKHGIPDEFANMIIYTGFNSGSLFPLFIAKVQRVFRKNENESICLLKTLTDIVRINKQFANEELQYEPSCKTNRPEEVSEHSYGRIWIEVEKSPRLTAWCLH